MTSRRTIQVRAAAVLGALLLTDSASRGAPAQQPTRPVEIVVRDQGFDWEDAAIGAVACLGLTCLGLGAFQSSIRRGCAGQSSHEKGERR